jgi:uncharacterized protein DUF1236
VQQNSIEPVAAVARLLMGSLPLFASEQFMLGWTRLGPLIALAVVFGPANAGAQSLAADEAVTPYGAVTQQLGLTPAQKSAIYNAVLQQRVRTSSTRIEPAVGAPVSRSIELAAIPEQAGIADATFLRYAVVAGDVVVVDPIRMRVVDVIHRSIGP